MKLMKFNRQMGVGYAILSIVVCFVLSSIGGFIYTNWRVTDGIDDNNKKFCKVLTKIISPGPDVPSPAPGTRAYEISEELNRLSKEYKCH